MSWDMDAAQDIGGYGKTAQAREVKLKGETGVEGTLVDES